MNFDPQIPEWGKEFTNNSKEELLKYHSWIKNTGIKSGLISPKSDQFIWDEFVIHSLYFYKIIFDLNFSIAFIVTKSLSSIIIKKSKFNFSSSFNT
jgi:16S rRNA G527 N7-methylase RsmG